MYRPLNPIIREGADAFIRLAALASSAQGLQWEKSPKATSRDDVDRKAAGGHGDPTGETVLDPRRLELREAADAAVLALEQSTAAAVQARKTLTRALESWHGEG